MIELSGVSQTIDGREVLREVDLRIDEHRVGIVGANGSGKSTLARMLNGLILPTTGTVTVDGLDTARDGAKVRRRVGFVFTDPDAQIVMPTVAEDVAFSLRRSDLDADARAARVQDVLRWFGLANHADHPAHLLSGGQKQMLALASVVVTRPEILVCDEPTTLLDLRNARRIAGMLSRLPQRVVMVTHDLDLLDGWDRVLVVDEGRVVADDVPAVAVQSYRTLMAGS